jgi:hypothetical protein
MRMTKEEEKYFHDKIYFALYEWRLLLAEKEIDTNFRILRSMQDPFTSLRVKKIDQLDSQRKKDTFMAFIKRFYDHDIFPHLKLTDYDRELIDHILNYPPLAPLEEIYDVDKSIEYEEKKRLYGKKIYRQKLFNRIKKKVKEEFKTEFQMHGSEMIDFQTIFTDRLKVNTTIFIDNRDYNYTHNFYIDDRQVMLNCNHATLIGFPSRWLIHQEEDIDITLNTIWSFCQEFFEEAGKILRTLDLDV